MQFFDFYNRQTFHFFQWLTRSGLLDVQAMVDKALADAERDEWFPAKETTSEVACRLLAEQIEEVTQELARRTFDFGLLEPGDDAFVEQEPHGYTSAEALFVPLVHDALESIMFPVVAQALLTRQGKWEPGARSQSG
jgi:hypothetical protein